MMQTKAIWTWSRFANTMATVSLGATMPHCHDPGSQLIELRHIPAASLERAYELPVIPMPKAPQFAQAAPVEIKNDGCPVLLKAVIQGEESLAVFNVNGSSRVVRRGERVDGQPGPATLTLVHIDSDHVILGRGNERHRCSIRANRTIRDRDSEP